MDKKQLVEEVTMFIAACNERGVTVTHCCLMEAFPGDPTTSYTLHIGSPVIEKQTCSDALQVFIDIMWEVMSEEARVRIFSINLVDGAERIHCASEDLLIEGEALA
jgi:hypothetical protein